MKLFHFFLFTFASTAVLATQCANTCFEDCEGVCDGICDPDVTLSDLNLIGLDFGSIFGSVIPPVPAYRVEDCANQEDVCVLLSAVNIIEETTVFIPFGCLETFEKPSNFGLYNFEEAQLFSCENNLCNLPAFEGCAPLLEDIGVCQLDENLVNVTEALLDIANSPVNLIEDCTLRSFTELDLESSCFVDENCTKENIEEIDSLCSAEDNLVIVFVVAPIGGLVVLALVLLSVFAAFSREKVKEVETKDLEKASKQPPLPLASSVEAEEEESEDEDEDDENLAKVQVSESQDESMDFVEISEY